MHFQISIPTKDNPVALAGALSALIATYQNDHTTVEVSICDTSHRPINTYDHINRLLAHLARFHYEHSVEPLTASEQRCRAGYPYREGPVIWMDDDCVPTPGWDVMMEDLLAEYPYVGFFVQGIKVDCFNDRGYPDHCHRTNGPHVDTHAFPAAAAHRGFVDDNWLLDTRPDTGLFVSTPQALQEVTDLLPEHTPHGVCDDAIAAYFKDHMEYRVHTCFGCWHMGNSNANWNGQEYKRFAVDTTVEQMTTRHQ